MDDKYKKLVDTLPKESEDLWFEYNLAVNKIIQENNQLKEQRQELRRWLEKEVSTFGSYRYQEVLNKLNELEGKNDSERDV